MSNVLVVIGSARKGRVADKVLEYIKSDLDKRDGVTYTVADLKEVNLPFFDNENNPTSPDYVITDPAVKAWSEQVQAADSVLFITPEYNHTLSAIQKNAIDSLGPDWVEKPISAVAYGWVGGARSVVTLRDVLENVKAEVKHNIAELAFMKELNTGGTLLDEASVSTKIATAIDEIV